MSLIIEFSNTTIAVAALSALTIGFFVIMAAGMIVNKLHAMQVMLNHHAQTALRDE